MLKINMLYGDVNHKTAKNVCLITMVLFILMHIGYLGFFFWNSNPILGYYNVGSVAFYIIWMFIISRVKHLEIYAVSALYEIFVFCSMVIFFVGWSYGTQYLFLGLIMLIYYTSYMAKKVHGINLHPVIFSLQCVAIYLFFAIYCRYNDPYYHTSQGAFFFNVFHIITSFVFDILFGSILANTAIHLENRIYDVSITDHLTRILNRKGIDEAYTSINNENLNGYVVAIYDIDNFKSLNDKYGHPYGDIILFEVSRIIKENVLDGYVSRWGGEEFVTIIKKEATYEETLNKFENIRKSIAEEKFKYRNKDVNVTITIGVSDYKNYNSLEEWVAVADKKLYDGKTSGKNKVVY